MMGSNGFTAREVENVRRIVGWALCCVQTRSFWPYDPPSESEIAAALSSLVAVEAWAMCEDGDDGHWDGYDED